MELEPLLQRLKALKVIASESHCVGMDDDCNLIFSRPAETTALINPDGPEAAQAITALRDALVRANNFLAELSHADLDDLAADGGVTVGMVFQKDAERQCDLIAAVLTKETTRHDD